MKANAKWNAFTAFFTQIVIIILGLVIPRIMIWNYGSDTNGLTSTLTQIFSYVALLEAGIGQATKNALYKPIADKDRNAINCVLTVSRRYYWKITRYYALAVLGIAVFLPFALKTDLSWHTVFAVILLEGMSGVVRFLYTENWMQLLLAEGKGYVQANINLLYRILTYAIKIILACMHVNIVAIQAGYFCVSLIQMYAYKKYMDKNYDWIDYHVQTEAEVELKDRNSYVLTEIAWTVFSSTDMILLSVMFSTALSSVYSVYNMVYSNISLLLNAVYTGLVYILGQTFHENMEKYKEIHDQFELIFMTTIALLMSCCSILAVPFVRLYTQGVTDIDYIYQYLPLLFGLVQILSWDRYVAGNLSGVAGYAGIVSKISVVEAVLNVTLSILLSRSCGIYGITLATAIALIVKLVYLTFLCNKKILNRSVIKSSTKMGLYLTAYLVISYYAIQKPLQIRNAIGFIESGICVFLAVACIYTVLAVIADYRSVQLLVKKLLGERFFEKRRKKS